MSFLFSQRYKRYALFLHIYFVKAWDTSLWQSSFRRKGFSLIIIGTTELVSHVSRAFTKKRALTPYSIFPLVVYNYKYMKTLHAEFWISRICTTLKMTDGFDGWIFLATVCEVNAYSGITAKKHILYLVRDYCTPNSFIYFTI